MDKWILEHRNIQDYGIWIIGVWEQWNSQDGIIWILGV